VRRARLLAHPRPLPSPLPAPPRHQIAAWKAGHKHECGAPGQGGAAAAKLRSAARGGAARAEAARSPAEQNRLLKRLQERQDADDWRGVVALEKEALALARDVRGADPGLAGKILGVLGLGFEITGDYGRARELHEQHRAMAEALGDRAGVARACENLGNCYFSTGDYGRARKLYEQHRAICEALGDRAGVARAYANLGNCYHGTGDYARARELHEQDRAICEALGDRAGVATACGNLGCCY